MMMSLTRRALVVVLVAFSLVSAAHAGKRKPSSSQVSPDDAAKTLQRLFDCAREFRSAPATVTEESLLRCAEPLFSRTLSEGQRRRLTAAIPLLMTPGEPGSCDSVPGARERFLGLPRVPDTAELCFRFELINRDPKVGIATFTQESGSAAILRLIY